jgi:hypothetical protein
MQFPQKARLGWHSRGGVAVRSRLQDHFNGLAELNEQGRQAVAKHVSRWRSKMDQQINVDLAYGAVGGTKAIEIALQAHYDQWVEGTANDLYAIYSDRQLRAIPSRRTCFAALQQLAVSVCAG